MEIIPDPVHAALFTLPFATAAIGVYLILWRPLLRYLDERDQVSATARHDAERFEREAVAQLARIDARLATARASIADQRIAARGRAGVKENEILGAARQQADERLSGALAEIHRERESASAALKNNAADLASHIAGRVLGREVRS